MMKTKRKLLALTVVLALMLTTVTVFGETYTKDKLSLSIVDGMATLTAEGKTYQLTKKLVVDSGGIDANGTVFLVWKSQNMYWYNYQLQGDDTTLRKCASGVKSLMTSGSGEALVVTGYVTTSGEKALPTLEELRKELGQTNPSEPSKPSEPTKPEQPDKPTEPSKPSEPTKPEQPDKPTNPSKPSEPTKPTAKPVAKITYAAKVVTKGGYKVLQNSKAKEVDKLKFQKGVLTYHGWTVKNVKSVAFDKKGDVVYITKKGSAVRINHSTTKRKTIRKKGALKIKVNKTTQIATYLVVKKTTADIKL